ncbi:hypothetical protein V8G54_014232 [Vigna mungo]|uniref:Uncharacterized protein n=1 Tax=Vigna mungo TaxID=3915 RepID=A0AAQ3NHA2_VIGMU
MGPNQECCMYEVRYPEVDMAVMIQVGHIEPVMVLRVDKEKGYINLREHRVYEEDIQACEERYNKSKLVHSIMRHIAEILNIDLEELYVHIGGHAFEAFKIISTVPDSVLNLSMSVHEMIMLNHPCLGFSSVGYGATQDIGPFLVDNDGHGNPACYSWNLLLELAFHTHTSGDYDQLGDDLIGHHLSYNVAVA